MSPAMLCKTSKKSKHGETRGETNEFKSKLACIFEEFPPNYHEDHFAGKAYNSLQHYNFCTQNFLVPQALKIPAAKAAVDKEFEKLEKIPALDLTKSQK